MKFLFRPIIVFGRTRGFNRGKHFTVMCPPLLFFKCLSVFFFLQPTSIVLTLDLRIYGISS